MLRIRVREATRQRKLGKRRKTSSRVDEALSLSAPEPFHLILKRARRMPSSEESLWNAIIQRARHEPLATDELLTRTRQRLEGLARRMLAGYPQVHRWEETQDVLQEAMVRLNRAMRASPPQDLQHFFRLAALQMRRTLIDLARRHQGPLGLSANHESNLVLAGGASLRCEALDQETPDSLEEWTALHEGVGRLRSDEREVFQLLWYQGLTQREAAEVLGVDERTIRRRWTAARLSLMKLFPWGGPGPAD